MKKEKIAKQLANVMCYYNKELKREIDYISFVEPKHEVIEIDKTKVNEEMKALYDYFPNLEQQIKPAFFIEKVLLEIFPKSFQIEIKKKYNDVTKYELDCAQETEGRFILISASLDINNINLYEHIYESRIHALQYGGFNGQAICVLPNHTFRDNEFDSVETRTICGVKIFDKSDFHSPTDEISAKHFVKSLINYVANIERHATNNSSVLEKKRSTLEPKTDITLEPIMQTSGSSFEHFLKILIEKNEFIYENRLVKLDECLFQFLGVKGEEENFEWVLVAYINVPPYEKSITPKYRRLIYQYVSTAIKFTCGHFRMIIFNNCDKSLEDECKVLGNDMKLRVFSINARQWKKWTNIDSKGNREFGAKQLLQTWSSGELANNKILVEKLRKLNQEANSDIKIPVKYNEGRLYLDDELSKTSQFRKQINKITKHKTKNETKFQIEFSRDTGQFISIKKNKV